MIWVLISKKTEFKKGEDFKQMETILELRKKRALCPHCQTIAHHRWYNRVSGSEIGSNYVNSLAVYFSACSHCDKNTIWHENVLIYPEMISVPQPNIDLPEGIKSDYLEAASVLSRSPKASAALLRLCLQKLCKHLGEKGENINTDIKSLVQKGLPVAIQKAMDSIRVIGNNAVHPGEIDPNENKDNAVQLFKFINIIAQAMITQPKEIEALYASLPAGAKEAVERRDQEKPNL